MIETLAFFLDTIISTMRHHTLFIYYSFDNFIILIDIRKAEASTSYFYNMIDWAPHYAIFAGDYNVVLNPLQDTRNYLHVNNPHAMNELNSQISSLNLIDIWRDLNPDAKTYTWQKFNQNKWARLDYFLISSSLLPFVQKADVVPSFCSDHSGISLDIDFEKFHRGRGFWKFNSSLLKNKDYIDKIKKWT